MGKLTTYLMIVTGILVLFHYSGIIGVGEGSIILDMALHPENMKQTLQDNIIVIAIGGIAGVGILIGAALTHSLELDLVAPVALFLWNLITDMLVIYNKVAMFSRPIAVIIFAVPMIILGVIILDWWRGRDVG